MKLTLVKTETGWAWQLDKMLISCSQRRIDDMHREIRDCHRRICKEECFSGDVRQWDEIERLRNHIAYLKSILPPTENDL